MHPDWCIRIHPIPHPKKENFLLHMDFLYSLKIHSLNQDRKKNRKTRMKKILKGNNEEDTLRK